MDGSGSETADTRLRRLRMRSWRRGTREMDLILGNWADRHLADLSDERLDDYEALLVENDQDLYSWISGRSPMPDIHADLLSEIRADLQFPQGR